MKQPVDYEIQEPERDMTILGAAICTLSAAGVAYLIYCALARVWN